jgi:subtilisin family serine protease
MNANGLLARAVNFLAAILVSTLSLISAVESAQVYVKPPDDAAQPAPPAPGPGGAPLPGQSPRVASRHVLVELEHGIDVDAFFDNARGRGLHKIGRVYGSNWFTVSIPQGMGPAAAVAAARGLPGVARSAPDPIVRINHDLPPPITPYTDDPFYIYDDDPSTKDCDPFIEVCDATKIVDQWQLFRVHAEPAWDVERGIAEAGQQPVVIAVLDSGVDLDHDDLQANIWTNSLEMPNNGVDDDGNGLVDDVHGADFVGANPGNPFTDIPNMSDGNPDVPETGTWVYDGVSALFGWRFDGDSAVGDGDDNNGDFAIDVGVFHGSFVAGVAAAVTNNLEGMAGTCWGCQIMAVRIINAEGWAYGSVAASGIRYAADQGADIINASWGIDINAVGPNDPELEVLRQAVDYAVSRGVIFVAAAGNGGNTGVHFPGTLPNVIAVGSTDWVDQRSFFSSFAPAGEIPDNGVDDDGNGWVDDVVDVVAPGELIWSTPVVSAYDSWILNGWLFEPEPDPFWAPGDDAYTQSNGTSFSTPLVAGYVGLILSANPGATLSQVREVVRSNALDLQTPDYDPQTGFGRVQMVVPTDLPADVNQPPVADAGSDQTVTDRGKPNEERVTLDGSGSSDPDGNIASYQWFEGAQPMGSGERVTVTLSVGTHAITLRVSDDDGATSEDQITVTVLPKNGGSVAPVAGDDSYDIVTPGDILAVGAPGVLGNDTDPSGGGLTAVEVTSPSNGTLTLNADGSFLYDHDGGSSASDSFTYKAVDVDNRESNVATVTISVGGSPPGPGDANLMYVYGIDMVKKGRALNVTVTVRRDSDADGVAEGSDEPVSNALVIGKLCSMPAGAPCYFNTTQVATDGNGRAKYKLFDAAGSYQFTVTSITHGTYSYDGTLDLDNPATYTP